VWEKLSLEAEAGKIRFLSLKGVEKPQASHNHDWYDV
jgi:hypothetical protein